MRVGVAVASVGVGIQQYMPMKLPSSREAYLKVIAVGLEAANAILPSSLCANPMLPLVATLAIYRATLDSPSVAPPDKVQVAEAGDYLGKRLATMATLVDESTPAVAAFFDASHVEEVGGEGQARPSYLILPMD